MQPDGGSATRPAPLLPTPDRDSAPWWEALAARQLLVQQCTACEHRRWPARVMCSRCGSFEARWERTGGTGTVAARTTTHHAFLPGFTTPYHTVLVLLDVPDGQDDIVMPGGWSGDAEPVVGQRVQADFRVVESDGERAALLQWRGRENGG
jgi:uncharacterized OB-fold protein